MDIPCVLEDYILQFIELQDRTTNWFTLRQVCKQWKTRIETSVRLEIDRDKTISIQDFIIHRQYLYIHLIQRRNCALLYEDYRGFLIVNEYDAAEWMYYDMIRRKLFMEPKQETNIIFPGKVLFYEL